MTISILTILGIWTVAACIAGPIIMYFGTAARRDEANHLPPLPSGSILGKHPERVS